jgi:hypothetical protein
MPQRIHYQSSVVHAHRQSVHPTVPYHESGVSLKYISFPAETAALAEICREQPDWEIVLFNDK